METRDRNERRVPYMLILLFTILVAGIVTVGYLYYQNYTKQYKAEVDRQLTTVAELKVDELVNWRNERLGDAGIFCENAAFSALVRRYFEKPADTDAQGQLRIWLSKVQTSYEYDRLMLLDAQGVERISIPDTPELFDSPLAENISQILRLKQMSFTDFYRCEHNQKIYLNILVPILDEQDDNREVGVLVLRIDPERYLYPLINRWPTPSRTAETLLVRREGSNVRFLNELRFQENAAVTLMRSLENREMPAVKAALGQDGIVEGINYRKMPVISCIHAVPKSPWFLIAQMDISEVYAPIKEKLWVTIGMVRILIAGTISGVGFLWRQQSVRYYRQKYEAEETLRKSEERYRKVFEETTDAIFVTDSETGIITDCNRAGTELVQREKSELVGKHQWILRPPQEAEGEFTRSFKQHLAGKEGHVLEAQAITKKGEIKDVEIRASLIEIEGRKVLYALFRDITERKKAEETQKRLVAIIEATPDFVGFADAKDKHIIYVNKAGRKMCGIGGDEDVTKLKISDVHPKWTNKMFAEEILPAAVRDGVWTGECAFLNIRDGHEIPVLMVLSSHKASNGEVEVFSTISRDITERKQAGTVANEAIIDWAKVIAGGLDEQQMKEIAPTYMKDNKERLGWLISAVKSANAKDVKLYAHAMKGAGRNMGAVKLFEVAGRLETMAAAEDLSKAEGLLKNIIDEFSRLAEFVSKPNWIETAKLQSTNTLESGSKEV